MKILILNGPNLNMLGIREPDVYGKESYQALVAYIEAAASEVGADVTILQSNHEGVLVDRIQEAYGKFDAIVINAAAYTHTSVAIADALAAVALPVVEVHLSDITKREAFRHHSYITPLARRVYMGKGFAGYRLAIRHLVLGEE